ncbi:MAG: hypothetical protein CVV22_05520 [Ignavibacteriae bacterium HGW-Ignavibacteriae-1]|jgi:hypothetical protein|nr:MAG: hypothetical protein CVV22_05520 [Ignavibacteriae bacterium HGW-Ignavibacteriae-1]
MRVGDAKYTYEYLDTANLVVPKTPFFKRAKIQQDENEGSGMYYIGAYFNDEPVGSLILISLTQ